MLMIPDAAKWAFSWAELWQIPLVVLMFPRQLDNEKISIGVHTTPKKPAWEMNLSHLFSSYSSETEASGLTD